MEYSFDEDLESILQSSFTRQAAEQKRGTIVKKTLDGRRHWFPVEVNAGEDLKRRDVAWEYGARLSSGAYYTTMGRIGYDPTDYQWKQVARDDEDSFAINTPVVLFDKIKVFRCVLTMENTSRMMMVTGAVGVQIRNEKNGSDTFLQEVSKCDNKGTVARYKLTDFSNLNHAHYNLTDEVCTINVNTPRGFYELAVNLRSISAWHRSKNLHARVMVHVIPEVENNNSATVDSIISAVRNELTFKDKAVRSNIMRLQVKSDFKTHKYIAHYGAKRVLSGTSPESRPDIINAVNCNCDNCKGNSAILLKNTFHRFKNSTCLTDKAHRIKCLAPLYQKNEIQVHDRCFNCSAVSGNKLLPVVCEIGGKLLTDDKTAQIDMALVRATAQLQLQSNGLLPSHATTLCELMCWREKTRHMTREKQVQLYKAKIEPLLSHLQFSRQNYAQSGGNFCQFLVRGSKLILHDDQSIISHKYNNRDTENIFRARKRCADDGKKQRLSKHPRRTRGPVFMATYGLDKFGERMSRHGLEQPREEEM